MLFFTVVNGVHGGCTEGIEGIEGGIDRVQNGMKGHGGGIEGHRGVCRLCGGS